MASAKPSVLLINRVYPPSRGASGRVLRDLAKEMTRAGWSVTVLTTGDKSFSEKDGGITVYRAKAPMNPRGVISYARVLLSLYRAAMKQPRHDLVVTLTDPPLLVTVGRRFAKKKRCSHMHWCQDLYPDLFPSIGVKMPDFIMRALSRSARRSMNKSGKVIAVGRCMAKYLAHTGVETGRISMIPNWPDIELVDPNRKVKRNDVRLKDNVPLARPAETLLRDDSPRFRILYAGNIGRAHPMKAILEAAEHLSSYPEIEFVFVGEGPNHDRLAAERARRGLQNIKLLPYQPASCLKDLMESGDLHLISMRDDAAGLLVPCKFYSAIAAARPTIYVGPADTEIGRMIRDYGCGAIVPQGDGQTLAQAIMYFRNDPDAWFSAQQGAEQAAADSRPVKSILSIMKEAETTIQQRFA
ncbi:MAG: glycosyltransferase WbuB [Micavibrio aeruginosavorus]|uniref:Glycosyltransferase WbuB n=1 Tax=Micavibrio aeruginosavorus TaxID=349221 RepID=A0A2W5MQ81_9BACT|nr:MAG: glycosyltransferase WbuB [Micavibrio aeruginosavorus]